ncbi:MAG: ribonuclease R [Phycisphaerae bacterium]
MAGKTDNLSTRILTHLGKKDYRPVRARRLARAMGIDEEEYDSFRTAVKELMRAGRVILGGGNSIALPTGRQTIIGTFRGHVRGFGFVVPESPAEHGDLFIPPGATMNAITGDTVAARLTRRGKGGDESRVEGEVVEIITRGQSRFVGELVRDGREWVMLPDGKSLHSPVLLGDVTATRARAGDQVVVELTEFPRPYQPARGVIVEVLGRRGDPGIDTLSIIRQYHFRDQFPEEVLTDVRRAIGEYDLDEELGNREDLRNEAIVTIDPDDAKDFDDAISIRQAAHGRLELGVHIADVSTFVRGGRPLDGEARLRANSIYLPRHVIPMLPEVLSNGLCSLQEAQPRLTKSAFIEYDARGRRVGSRFANTVIQSRKRLTYREATGILEGRTGGFQPEVVELLRRMDALARAIRKRRLADGMIVLDLPEVELVLNEDGEVTGVEPADTSFSHTIIEMFMVEANEAVAELLTGLGVPHLRRIHPDPPPESQRKLAQFLRVLGRPLPEKLTRRDMIRTLESVRGKPESFAVNLAVLRSLAQAEYSPKMEGHFALASEHYSHFTSPIRRYPDLVVHRLLQTYLEGRLRTRRDRESVPSQETLTEIGKHCSYNERRAEDAERELKQVKILTLLESRLGEIEDGVVTGVANVGVYVQLRRYLIDGLIRFADLQDDWWEIDVRAGCAIGQRSGRRIGIGDLLRVQIAAVDIASRELDLVLQEVQQSSPRSAAAAVPVREKQAKAKRTPARGRRGATGKRTSGRQGRTAGRRGRRTR